MIFATRAQVDAIPPGDLPAFVNAHLDYDDQLNASGNLIASEGLESSDKAVVVRMRKGKLSVTDGPFIETNEQLGGFYLVDAGSDDEAMHIAAGIPSVRVGSIEVRPVLAQHDTAEDAR